jgi:hypothetical protein
VWVEQDAPGQPLVRSQVGQGFPQHIRSMLSATIGRPVEKTIDTGYGRYAQEIYSTVASSGRPLLEDVDAQIATDGHQQVSRHYRRLILPLAQSNGARSLLCLSVFDTQIDLRRASG